MGERRREAEQEVRPDTRDRLEYDFSRLRRRDTWTRGERYWGAKMDAMLGRNLAPTVFLADSVPQASMRQWW